MRQYFHIFSKCRASMLFSFPGFSWKDTAWRWDVKLGVKGKDVSFFSFSVN